MTLVENDLEFDFTDAVGTIKFDGSNHTLSHCMKAVDFIVELPEVYLFVEVKDPSIPTASEKAFKKFEVEASSGFLCGEIVRKFRDSFIYRWAERKTEKPIHFISLITLETPLLNALQDDLRRRLPFIGTEHWSRKIAESCHAINIETWNRNFPKWPVRRASDDT